MAISEYAFNLHGRSTLDDTVLVVHIASGDELRIGFDHRQVDWVTYYSFSQRYTARVKSTVTSSLVANLNERLVAIETIKEQGDVVKQQIEQIEHVFAIQRTIKDLKADNQEA